VVHSQLVDGSELFAVVHVRSVLIEGVMHWTLGKREIHLAGEKDARRGLEVKHSDTMRSSLHVTCK
jgi:hypothetical protein